MEKGGYLGLVNHCANLKYVRSQTKLYSYTILISEAVLLTLSFRMIFFR